MIQLIGEGRRHDHAQAGAAGEPSPCTGQPDPPAAGEGQNR